MLRTHVRLLLANNHQVKAGLGNSSGLIGQYFTEHIEVYVGSIISATNAMDDYITFGNTTHKTSKKIRIFPGFVMTHQEQKKLGVLSCNLAVQTMRNPASAVTALKSLQHDVSNGDWPDQAFTNSWRVLSGVGTLYDEWQARKGNGDNNDDMVTGIFARSEQAPNANSYLQLDPTQKDAFGIPRIQIHWQLSPLDIKTIKVTTEAFGAELARQNLGRVQLLDWLADEEWGLDTIGGHHHLGTTKMSQHPKDGVVNTDLRLHDVENMSVLSSAVFPNGGYANPTLSIAAFAFRLGDHLKTIL